MHTRTKLLAFLAILLLGQGTVHAQSFGIHYGPRSFSTAPIGTNAIDLKYENLDASISTNGQVIKGFNLKTNSGIVSYTHFFDFFGQTASIVAALPYVKLEGNLDILSGSANIFDESGIADPYFQFYTTLVGGKAQEFESFVRSEPGFILGAFAAARPPIGEYDPLKPANPSGNRWEFRLGLPIQYISGLPTQQTSFEFVPAIYLFGDNDDAFGGGTLGTDPLFQFEGHITHDLSRMFWGSLNLIYMRGGASSTNGVDQDNEVDHWGTGFTLGARLPHSFGAIVTYGTSLRSKTGNEDGHWIRTGITWTF